MRSSTIIFITKGNMVAMLPFFTDASARRHAQETECESAYRVHNGRLIQIFPLEEAKGKQDDL
jgi:hypothetical protein